MSCDMSCYVFSANSTSCSYPCSNGSTCSVIVTSRAGGDSVDFSITSKPDWITASSSLNSPGIFVLNTVAYANLTSSSRSGTIVLTQSSTGKTISISVEQEACATSCTCKIEGWIDMTMGSADPSYNTLEVAYCLTARKSASTCNITKPTATMIFFDKNAAQNVLGEKDLSLMNWDSPYCGTEYYNTPSGTQLSNIMCQLTSTSGCVTRDVTINK